MNAISRSRKKQPEAFRQQILTVAMALAAEEGPSALTLDRVAREANVSKGGLLHHFRSKHDLFAGLMEEVLRSIDEEVAAIAENDPIPSGRYVRAYLQIMADHSADKTSRFWGVLSTIMLFEPSLRERYDAWIAERPSGSADEGDDIIRLSIVRLACDGLWIADLLGNTTIFGAKRETLIAQLREMTLPA